MKNKSALLSGISMFFCFCILVAGGSFGKTIGKGQVTVSILFSEVFAFLLPTLFLLLLLRGKDKLSIPLTIKKVKPKNFKLAIYIGISTCILSFLLNIMFLILGSQDVSGINPAAILGRDIQQNFFMYLLSIVIIPAIMEEIYIRGAIFSIFSRYAGTWVSMLISSLVFAMLHGSLYNFVGPFIAGLSFSWLTYVFKSVWPAVVAHAVNNLGYLFILWVTDTYSAFGIWNYIPYVCIFLLLLFTYLILANVEKLLLSGRVPKFKIQSQISNQSIRTIALNPGAIVFIVSFFAKTVFKII